MKYQKLSDYANTYNITYKTAWNRYKKNKISNAFIDETGHVVIPLKENITINNNAIIYARVSNNDRKKELDYQLDRIKNYAISNGFNIVDQIKEIASGMNDNRKKLNEILNRDDWTTLIVENKDRLTRFGFNYIELLLKKQGKNIIIINKIEEDKKDLLQDLISIFYSFSARIYGLRKRKNKKELIKFIECI